MCDMPEIITIFDITAAAAAATASAAGVQEQESQSQHTHTHTQTIDKTYIEKKRDIERDRGE